ncbi:MAG: hypothetical protein JWR63_550 [Conexibacter sp.]|nr:hypothetical protein [Conexibacter sp.]
MSERRRTVAGSPERSATETADVLLGLVRDTLAPAAALDGAAVANQLQAARSAVRKLVTGGHLDVSPLVLDAPPLRLSLSTVSGVKAIDFDENLNTVQGAATATTWTLHVPTPEPLGAWLSDDVQGLENVTTDPPKAYESAPPAAALNASDLDLEALRRITGEA